MFSNGFAKSRLNILHELSNCSDMTLINIIKLTKKFFFIFRPFYTIDFQNIKICQKTPYVYHHVQQKNCGQNWPRSDPWVLNINTGKFNERIFLFFFFVKGWKPAWSDSACNSFKRDRERVLLQRASAEWTAISALDSHNSPRHKTAVNFININNWIVLANGPIDPDRSVFSIRSIESDRSIPFRYDGSDSYHRYIIIIHSYQKKKIIGNCNIIIGIYRKSGVLGPWAMLQVVYRVTIF